MKIFIHLVLLVILASMFVLSCDDILSENPKSFLTPANFPNSQKDAIAATNAAYSRLYINPREVYFGFVSSDIAFQGFHNQRPLAYFQGLDEFNGDSNELWQTAYEGIVRANTVIDLVPDVNMDPVLRERLVAEAKFLRALYYFGLVRKYGGVPVIDRILSGPDELEGIARNSVGEVYSLIKNDLSDAISVLPPVYPDAELGRATVWAARGVLAKVHLTLEEWDQANNQLQMIIDSGQFGLIADYNKLFGVQNETQMWPDKHGELVTGNIFSVQFAADERGHTLTQQTGSRDLEIGGNNNHYGGFENMLPTPEFRDMFEPGDQRVEINYVTEVDGNVLESPVTPGAGPINAKYQNPELGPPEPFNSGNNVYVVRYADVLLMRAEAENELNGPGNAYQYINLVRERAGVPELADLTQDELRQAIRKERATELAFEGHRRYDLLRWGIYVETMRNTTSHFLEIPRANIQDFHVLLPIPNREIQASNGSIEQNPGY